MSEQERFNTSFRGYDKGEVEAYLNNIAASNQAEITKVRHELADEKALNQKLKAQADEAANKAADLEKQHKDYLVNTAARENEQVRKYKNQLSVYTQQIDQLKADITAVKDERNKLKDEAATLNAKVKSGETNSQLVSDLKAKNDAAAKEVDDLKHQVEVGNQRIAQTQKIYDAFKKDAEQKLQQAGEEHNKKVAELQETIAKLQKDFDGVKQQNTSLKTELTKPSNMSAAAQALVADKDRMIQSLQNQVASLKSEVTNAVKAKSVSAESTGAALRAAQSSLSDAQRKIADKDKELASLTAKTKQIIEEAEHTADTFGKLRASIHQRDEQIWDLQKQIASVTGERDILRQKLYSFYTSEAGKLKAEMDKDGIPVQNAEVKKEAK